MKVLLTGGSGLLGRQVLALFKAENVDCTGLCFSRASEGLVKLDITNLDETRSYIEKLRPTHIIHAAAQRFPDKVEADFEGTLKLNVESTRNLALLCKELGSRMIYISTDYVFDGRVVRKKSSQKKTTKKAKKIHPKFDLSGWLFLAFIDKCVFY